MKLIIVDDKFFYEDSCRSVVKVSSGSYDDFIDSRDWSRRTMELVGIDVMWCFERDEVIQLRRRRCT